MKSYCIKTDNERIIEYLLNKISKLEFPNIYYCKKSLKIYENVVMHYKDEYIDKFNNIVTTLIVDTIRTFFEERILKRIINVNYFYFDEFERNIIYDDCNEFLKQDDVEINETIFKQIKNYIKENKNIVLEGVVNFRINDYVKILDNIVDMAVNLDIIVKSGSWFSYKGEKICQGRENVKKYLTDNPDMMAEIEKKVRDNFEKAFEQSLGEELPEDKEETEEPEE